MPGIFRNKLCTAVLLAPAGTGSSSERRTSTPPSEGGEDPAHPNLAGAPGPCSVRLGPTRGWLSSTALPPPRNLTRSSQRAHPVRDERYEVTPGITSGSCSSQKLDPVIAASTRSQRQGASLGQGGPGPGACTGLRRRRVTDRGCDPRGVRHGIRPGPGRTGRPGRCNAYTTDERLGPGWGSSVGCRWAPGRLEGLKEGETINYVLTATPRSYHYVLQASLHGCFNCCVSR